MCSQVWIMLCLMSIVGVVTYILVKIKYTKDLFNSCIVPCGPECSPLMRKLLLDWNGIHKHEYQRKQLCIFNYWNLSHVLFYFILSIMFPQYRLLMFLIGVGWETGEYIVGHHNNLDVIWNLIGILAGMIVRP